MSFIDRQEAQGVKGAIHGVVFTLAALCGVYNSVAFYCRHDRHLLVNAVVYLGLMGFEVFNVHRHCRGGTP